MTSDQSNPSNDGQLRSVLLLLSGVAVLVIALVLLFNGDFFSGDPDGASLESLPAFSEPTELGLAASSRNVPLPVVGDEALDFTLLDLDGNRVTLSELRGRPVLLNFWATWCPPCRLEMPELQQTQQDYEAQNLVVLTINEAESAEQVRDFFDELGLTMPAVLDSDGDVGNAYGAAFLPSTIFINPDGVITAMHRGIISRSQIDGYLLRTLPLES
jgi:peroxiredoxin